MENVTVTQQKEVVQRIVRHTPVTENYVAVQVEKIRTALKDDVLGKVLEKTTFETICHKKTIPLLKKDGVTAKIPNCDVVLMTDAVLRCYQEHGYDVHYEKDVQESCGLTEDDLDALRSPFTALSKGLKVTPVKCDYSSHMLFHPEKDEIYPVAIFLNYIEAGLDNKKYDLPKALSILEGRSDVRVLKANGKGIDRIPYYNASDDRNECIEAYYMPTHEAANRLWQTSKKIDSEFPSCNFEKAIDVIDALGLIAGGAMKEKYVKLTEKWLEK